MEGPDECTASCQSRQHGDELSAVIMSPMLTDMEVAAYLPLRCRNYASVWNSAGQSLAHVAAAAGRLDLLRLLLHLRDCLNETDEESSYTPLHVSLLHGEVHCAVRLIQLGGDQNVTDSESLTPGDIVMKDRPPHLHELSSNLELYVWGSNTNYNLGCGHNRERSLPEPHDFFQKAKLSIRQVAIEKFHAVFLDCNDCAWGCGLGVRAGLGVEAAALEPRRLVLPETVRVASIAISEQHTVLLSVTGTAFTCGLNTYAVLGHPQKPPSLPVPKPVRGLPALTGICAAQFHSVFYSDSQLYVCGTNVGQLGHAANEGNTVVVPREVTAIKMKGANISSVAASEGATVLLNSEGAVYLLSGYRCTRLTPRDWLRKSRAIAVVGGPTGGGADVELRVALLTTDDMLYLWRASTTEFLPCVFSVRRQLKLYHLALSNTGCLFTTDSGEAFLGFFRDVKKSKTVEVVDVRRLAHIHRGGTVSADSRGRNFAVIQHSPQSFSNFEFPKLISEDQPSSPSLRKDLEVLLSEACEDDIVHDVVFKVSGRTFVAHSYIIFHSNEHTTMKKLLLESSETGVSDRFDLGELPLEAFSAVLRYVYTMQCSYTPRKRTAVEEETTSAYAAYRQKGGAEKGELGDLRFVARRLGVSGLLLTLDGRPPSAMGLARKAGVHDTVLVAQDGTRVRAHKCVLVARLEFFRVMLTHGWRESAETEVRVPVTGHVLEVLVEFLYLDRSYDLEESNDIDFLSLVLVSADGLLCEGLKTCAGLGLQRLMNLRNAADLLQLASTCNARQLMTHAQRFIIANLAAFLESRSLEILPDERLEELSCIYKSCLPARRRLKSSLDPLEVAMVRSLAEAFPVTLEDEIQVAKPTAKPPKKKRERKTSERQRRVSGDSCEEAGPVSPKPVKSPNATASPLPVSPVPVVTAPPVKDLSQTSSIVLRRLNVITENINSPPPAEALTLLIKKAAQVSLDDFPQLDGPRLDRVAAKPSSVELPKKFTKLSQRERRRLASLTSTEGESPSHVKDVASPPRSAWAPLPPREAFLPNSTEKPIQMEAIIDSERAERERAARLRSKPLTLTQMEDRALHELEVFYNVTQVTDERITVQRLVTPAAAPPPVWPVSRWR